MTEQGGIVSDITLVQAKSAKTRPFNHVTWTAIDGCYNNSPSPHIDILCDVVPKPLRAEQLYVAHIVEVI